MILKGADRSRPRSEWQPQLAKQALIMKARKAVLTPIDDFFYQRPINDQAQRASPETPGRLPETTTGPDSSRDSKRNLWKTSTPSSDAVTVLQTTISAMTDKSKRAHIRLTRHNIS